MGKIQVSEATSIQLDWLVAKCEYDELAAKNLQFPKYAKHYPKVSPSTDWSQGGPIIEREMTGLFKRDARSTPEEKWQAICGHGVGIFHQGKRGPTPLIAAMRCYVTSKLGDTVEIPEELM